MYWGRWGGTERGDSATMFAFDSAAGKMLWKTGRFDAIAQAAFLLLEDTEQLIVGSDAFNSSSVNPLTGDLQWQFASDDGSVASPVVGNGGRTLFLSNWDGSLFAVDRASGALSWKFATADPKTGFLDPFTLTPVASADGSIVYAGGGSSIWAFAAQTGKVLWQRNLTEDMSRNPVVGSMVRGSAYDGHTLLYTYTKTSVYALVDVDGTIAWNYTVSNQGVGIGAMVLYSGVLIVAATVEHDVAPPGITTFTDSIYALSVSTGEKLWSMPTKTSTEMAPLVDAAGWLYIADQSLLYALALDMGPLDSAGGCTGMNATLKWTFALPSVGYASAALANDGTLWIGSSSWRNSSGAHGTGGMFGLRADGNEPC